MTQSGLSVAEIASKFINNTNKNVFLTGKAGTGKTTFLKNIIHHTYKKTVVVAPTGIAAINAGGVTIHSLFQLPFGAFIPDKSAAMPFSENSKINTPASLFKTLQLSITKRRLIQEIELLIIDEVSMLRADLLDAIDLVLRTIRKKNHLPFGGVQVLFIGDMLQLPPVVKDEEWNYLKKYYSSPYFFHALVLQQNKPLYLELDKIYRQQDSSFVNLLNNLRNNQVSEEDITLLNKHYQPNFSPSSDENYIHLTTHNYKADRLNNDSLNNLKEQSYFFDAEVSGEFNEYTYPVDVRLELKKGAQVMFVKNDPTGAQRFFNGKIGVVSAINNNSIEVTCSDMAMPLKLEKYKWENIKYSINETTNEIEEKLMGTFEQYPIKLAWAITVHKSQGLTFQKAIIDVEGAFAHGQVYVALSRLTGLDGLVLSSPVNFNSLGVDSFVSSYSSEKESPDQLGDVLKGETIIFLKNYLSECFNFNSTAIMLKEHIESYSAEDSKSVKGKYFEWAMELKKDFDAQKLIADKFINQLAGIFNGTDEEYKKRLKERVTAAKNHFQPLLKSFSKRINTLIEKLKIQKRVKTYLKELLELDAALFKLLQQIEKAELMADSLFKGEEFSKENIHSRSSNTERINELSQSTIIKSDKKSKKEKKEKIDTKKISFDLYKNGFTLEQIAKERGMVETTIEGHLAYYVSLGMIDVLDFVNKQKMENIITVSKTLDTTLFGPIKQHLGEEYSYSDIRFAMAYYSNANKE